MAPSKLLASFFGDQIPKRMSQSHFCGMSKVDGRIKRNLKKEAEENQKNLVAVEDAHSRRPRCAYFGELEQMDATPDECIPGEIWAWTADCPRYGRNGKRSRSGAHLCATEQAIVAGGSHSSPVPCRYVRGVGDAAPYAAWRANCPRTI